MIPDDVHIQIRYNPAYYGRAYNFKMLQDKIHHNLIKINQLTLDNQSIRYIIPLYFNAIRFIHDNCAHYRIQPTLIEQVITRFRTFQFENQNKMAKLDQVHFFMMEECVEMIQAKHFQSRSEIKKNKSRIFSKIIENEDSYLKEEELIFLPQEEYFLDKNLNIIQSTQSSSCQDPPVNKSNIIRPISLDGIPTFQHNNNDIGSLWQQVEAFYHQHRLDEALVQCEKFQNSLFLYDPNCKLPQYKYDLIEKIHDEYNTMAHYYQYFNEPGYEFDKAEKGISMYYKIIEQTKEVSVRVEAELEISIQNFLCIVSEVDLFQQFVPFAYDTKQLKAISRNSKVGLTRAYIPLLSNRQAFFYAAAYDRLKTHNSIFFYSKTIASDLEFQKKIDVKIEKDPDLVELQYKFYIIQYCPISNGRGKVRLATNIDMKLGFLPLFIINKTLRIFSFDYFKNMLKVSKNIKGSAWEQKMQENKETYDFFKQKIQLYLQGRSN